MLKTMKAMEILQAILTSTSLKKFNMNLYLYIYKYNIYDTNI